MKKSKFKPGDLVELITPAEQLSSGPKYVLMSTYTDHQNDYVVALAKDEGGGCWGTVVQSALRRVRAKEQETAMADMTAEERRFIAAVEAVKVSRCLGEKGSATLVKVAFDAAEKTVPLKQAAAAQARAEMKERCAVLVEVSPDGIRCPFDDPNCKVEFKELCPVCGQDNNAEGSKQCAAAIRALSD